MKRFLSCLCIWSLLLIFSCNNEDEIITELVEAEQLMGAFPDSSLRLLTGIEAPERLSREQYATYCLLLTQALDKNYTTHVSDSLISIAAEYFEKEDDYKSLMLSYFYMGRVSQDLQNSLKAQDYYLKALEVGKNSKDYGLLARICSNMGDLYTEQGVFEMALPYSQKAVHYFELANEKESKSFAFRNIGRIYSVQKDIDNAIISYKKALDFSGSYSKSSILSELGTLYREKGEYELSRKYIDESLENTRGEEQLYIIYLSLGKLLLETGVQDSAMYYFKQSTQSTQLITKASAYFYLLQMAKEEKDYLKTIDLYDTYMNLADSVINIADAENMRKIDKLYSYHQAEKEADQFKLLHLESKKNGYKLILLVSFLVFFLVAVLVTTYTDVRKRKKEWLAQKLRFKQASEQLRNESSEKIATNQKRIQELELILQEKGLVKKELLELEVKRLELENVQIEQSRTEKEWLEKEFVNTSIYNKFQNLSANWKPTTTDINELKKAVDITYPKFARNLQNVYPEIADKDWLLCYLTKANVRPILIARIMNISKQAVTMRRVRLYKKITGEKCRSEVFDRFIASM